MPLAKIEALAASSLWVNGATTGWLARRAQPSAAQEAFSAVLHNDSHQLLWSGAVVLGAVLVGWLAAALVFRALGRWARKTDTVIDDAIALHLRRPLRWMMPLVALNVVLPLVSVPADALGTVRQTLLVVAIAVAGWTAVRVVRVLEHVVSEREDLKSADNLRARALLTQTRGFRNVANFLIFMLTLGFILITFERVRQLGTTLLASAGVAGIVLGFAAQRTIATVLAGIQIAITQPIRVDDVVIVEGEWGRIEEITLTYVVVRIWDKRRLVLPIGYFIEKPFQNWTRVSADLLGTVNLYLDYSVPVDEIRKECKRILDDSKLWDGEVWAVQVTDTTERTMLVRPLFSAKNSSDQWDLRCEVREKLIQFVQKNYPHALPRLRAESLNLDADG
jgi:small-conductance mechanosensitive channel